MPHYIGILEGRGSTWSIRVPDLVGCHGGGDTPDAAIADTISAMTEWSATLIRDGVAIPPARTVHQVIRDKASEFDPAAGESIVMLPLLIESGRAVKANVSLDAGMLEVIDAEAALRGITRSAFLISAARDKIVTRK